MAEIDIRTINKSAAEDLSHFIENSERRYTASLEFLINRLEKSNAKIILLAGPSSSGKTTTANIIKDTLAERGHQTVVISMDNFYRNTAEPTYPRDSHGELDFESVDALYIDRLHDCIGDLLSDGEAIIPKFSFKKGGPDGEERVILKSDGFVIIEGIHALNPVITAGLDRSKIFKLFISVSTNINNEGKRILSGRKIRFIRRMTRDSLYRSTDAFSTLVRWESVIYGEDKYLYPYKDTADYCFDTFHEYELGVMKPFAKMALDASKEKLNGEFIDIIRNALEEFSEISIDNVPNTSLIREFVPGGKYEDLYS